MIKAIIFDFDGVLVESVDIKTETFKKLFVLESEYTIRRILDYHLRNGGVSRFEKFRYIYKDILKRELPEACFEDLCQRFSGIVTEEVAKAPYVKGAKDFLNNYATKYRCFVSSATPEPEIIDIIKKRKMSTFFLGIYGAPKKKSDIVRHILSRGNLSTKEAVYVGDALSDYHAAITNDVNFIARIHNNESIFTGIDCIKLRDLTKLRAILKTNF